MSIYIITIHIGLCALLFTVLLSDIPERSTYPCHLGGAYFILQFLSLIDIKIIKSFSALVYII